MPKIVNYRELLRMAIKENIERFNADLNQGLSDEQVQRSLSPAPARMGALYEATTPMVLLSAADTLLQAHHSGGAGGDGAAGERL